MAYNEECDAVDLEKVVETARQSCWPFLTSPS